MNRNRKPDIPQAARGDRRKTQQGEARLCEMRRGESQGKAGHGGAETSRCLLQGAFGFPDIVDFSPHVRAYGAMLKLQCPKPCLVVQHRVGSDWEWHKRLKTGGSIANDVVNEMRRQYPRHSCLVLTPERVNASVSCQRLVHTPDTTPMLRFFAELYVATQADVFAYNPQSTMHWVVRHLSPSSLTLTALKQERVQKRGVLGVRW